MVNDPLKLQLAIQGGGAKICALLAAAEHIQELEQERNIHVTRIAGTSAGSIVACLLAGRIAVPGVRERLKQFGKQELSRLFPNLSGWKMILRLSSGKPFWNTDGLRMLLDEFFTQRGLLTLGDLKAKTGTQVLITASDITNSKKVLFDKDTDSIISSVLSSCAFPFAFCSHKTVGQAAAIVDGGICENLPVEDLTEKQDEMGQIIGISFKSLQAGRPPANPIDFAKSLLDTSINNSMLRAKESIGRKRTFDISTKIGTFDFKKAFTSGLEEQYDLVKFEAKEFFRTLLIVRQPDGDKNLLVGDPWRDTNSEMLKKFNNIYKFQHEDTLLEYDYFSLVVHANCLFNQDDPRHSIPDQIDQEIVFRSIEGAVYCHKLSLGSTTATSFSGRLSCRVKNKDGQEHPSEIIPSIPTVQNPQAKKLINRDILVFFTPPIRMNDPDGPHTIIFKDLLSKSMEDLKIKGRDLLEVKIRRTSRPIKKMDLILLLPEDFGVVTMSPLGPKPVGREMSQSELAQRYLPYGFRALGWTASNVDPETSMGVEFLVSS